MIVLFMISIIGFFVSGILNGLDNEEMGFTIAIISFALLIISSISIVKDIENNAYKEGQVDALTGDVQYELHTEKDSTRSWIKKDE